MHVTAGKAIAFGEALQPGSKAFCRAVIANARALAARRRSQSAAQRSSRPAPIATWSWSICVRSA